MPKIIGKGVTVVEHGGMKIEELAGNVASCDDTLSIAHVTVSNATSEPWLTLKYDEWLCCLEGVLELHHHHHHAQEEMGSAPQVLRVEQGETCFVAAGERFRPVFPHAGVKYVAVCLPAFTPDRCVREEEGGEGEGGSSGGKVSDVSAKLRELHSSAAATDDVLYHMCQKFLWEAAQGTGDAYFPPTFEQDGGFTHATAVPARLIDTANHFYTAPSTGDWICLELSKAALQRVGIVTRFEEPKAVGGAETANEWNEWRCPHIFGGIPAQVPGVVKKTFPMTRDEAGNFLCIKGLTELSGESF